MVWRNWCRTFPAVVDIRWIVQPIRISVLIIFYLTALYAFYCRSLVLTSITSERLSILQEIWIKWPWKIIISEINLPNIYFFIMIIYYKIFHFNASIPLYNLCETWYIGWIYYKLQNVIVINMPEIVCFISFHQLIKTQ